MCCFLRVISLQLTADMGDNTNDTGPAAVVDPDRMELQEIQLNMNAKTDEVRLLSMLDLTLFSLDLDKNDEPNVS
jgi:hypothetical protein